MTKSIIKFTVLFLILLALCKNALARNKETYELLDLFGQIFDQVRENYVEEVDMDNILEGAIKDRDENNTDQFDKDVDSIFETLEGAVDNYYSKVEAAQSKQPTPEWED